MTGADEPTRVKAQRERLRMTQAALAQAAGISRQALSAIEAGRVEPSVGTAVRLAKALQRSVEELFAERDARDELEATLVGAPGDVSSSGARRVALAFIQDRWVAHPLDSAPSAVAAASGVARGRATGARDKQAWAVELLQPEAQARETVILTGCAPALGLLAARLNEQAGPGRFVWLERSSVEALAALERGHAHVAGVHFHDQRQRDANAAAITQRLGAGAAHAYTLSAWQAGLVLARGNPLRLRSPADLARARVRIAGRARGTGARMLLEQQLEAAQLRSKPLLDRALVLRGQLDVGRAVALGAADVGLALEHAALAFGLSFLPLARERFDLVIARAHGDDPRIRRMLDTINGLSFRRELASLGGYDVASCGAQVELG